MRFLLLLLLLAFPAWGQEVLSVGPGQALRLHAAPRADQPVSRRYAVTLSAGDWIAISAPAAQVNGAAEEPSITVTGPGGDLATDFGRVVVQAGEGGLHLVSVLDFHALSIARYPAGHPLVDPGLREEEVRVDGRPLGATPSVAREALDLRYDDAPPPSGWPARLAVAVGDAMVLHLYRRDAMRQMELWPADPVPVVAALLRGGAPIEAGPDLPLFPVGNFSVDFATQAERRRGPCMDWVRYVAHHTQETYWPFERLAYVALGLSRDGRYFATAMAEAALAPMPGQPSSPQDGVNLSYEAALRRQIATDRAALNPPLSSLDAVLESLVFPCPVP